MQSKEGWRMAYKLELEENKAGEKDHVKGAAVE